MKTASLLCIVFSFLLLLSCIEKNPNKQSNKLIDNQQVNTVSQLGNQNTADEKFMYVPIYSDIYNKNRKERTLLTATLSVRNTSRKDTLFLTTVDYYDTAGKLVRGYLEEPIYLKPLESLDYVIEESDKAGGTGANFLVGWYAHQEMTPLMQAVMLGGLGHRAFSFTTEGIAIE